MHEAFSGCADLVSVTIPDTVLFIGERAFSGCNALQSVTIPDSIRIIEKEAFSGCVNLTDIRISADHPFFEYKDGALIDKESGILMCFLQMGRTCISIPDGVKAIADNVFSNCGDLVSVTIPDSVRFINDELFMDCESLKRITIPLSGIPLLHVLFYGCRNLTDIYFSGSLKAWECLHGDIDEDITEPIKTVHFDSGEEKKYGHPGLLDVLQDVLQSD